jgi:hypothetical protein
MNTSLIAADRKHDDQNSARNAVKEGGQYTAMGKGLSRGVAMNDVVLQKPRSSGAHSIFVSGGDVYVSGQEYYKGGPIPTVWKNGLLLYHLVDVNSGGGTAYSIYVSGDDVYVAGWEQNAEGYAVPSVWKNGSLLYRLVEEDNVKSRGNLAYSISVSGEDVYVAGAELIAEGDLVPSVWKNGSLLHRLPCGKDGGFARSICVSDGNVYVAGSCYKGEKGGCAVVWKNGSILYELDAEASLYQESIFVSGDDVYVAGYELLEVTTKGKPGPHRGKRRRYQTKAILWKNGQVHHRLGGGKYETRAMSVFASRGDVYVAGYAVRGRLGRSAVVWKNGQIHWRGRRSTHARSVFVSDGDIYVAGNDRGLLPAAIIWKNGEIHWKNRDCPSGGGFRFSGRAMCRIRKAVKK